MKKFRFIIGLIIVVAVLHFIPALNRAEAWVVSTGSGVTRGIRAAVLILLQFPATFRDAATREEEIARLTDELNALRERLSNLSGAADENTALRALLDFREKTNATLVAANVTGVDPEISVHAIIIDRGSTDGISRGDAVITGSGVLVGKIIRISQGRSTVLLTSDERSRIAAMVQGRPEANGVASGDRGLVVKLSLVPQHAAITVGDLVVTTGLEAGVPRGLLLGTVDSVSESPGQPFMSAIVVPAVDPLHLTTVGVIHLAP